MPIPGTLFEMTFALVFYVTGASCIESFVNYRTWPLIAAAGFRSYHRAVSRRIVPFLVLPYLASLILTIALLGSRPAAVPAWSVWLSLAFNLIVVLVSTVSQIPIQLGFDRTGFSAGQFAELTRREWLRKAPLIANGLLFFWMMARTLAVARPACGAGL